MTKEEAIKGLTSLLEVRRKYGDMQTMKDEIECLEMAIKALEQEPYEDAELVSIRQELLERGNEVVSFRHLVERFEGVEKEYKGVPWNLKQIYNNFNILIGEEPCDDCISRKDTLAEFKRVYFDNGTVIRCAESVLRGMPLVTPQQKTGRWNRVTDNAGYWVWECDKCGWQQRFHTNYCPDCGAKMQEVE